MRVLSSLAAVLLAVVLPAGALSAYAQKAEQAPLTSPEERALLHNSPEWLTVEPHLPDPKTATAARLELAGDVLRARRFPEDALDYYGYAIQRGGDLSSLMNKMGVVRLELQQTALARELFLRTVKSHKNNAQAWNNLGATDYILHDYKAAVGDYRHATKLDKHAAVYHANLGMAYFELKDAESARREFTAAIRIDPKIMQGRDSGGVTAHVIGTQNYPELCFEMAALYARNKDIATAKLWLSKASEGGYDVVAAMKSDTQLAGYLKDDDVKLMLANSAQLRSKKTVAQAKAPGLGAASDESHIN